jgi:signal transduction histidine kinase
MKQGMRNQSYIMMKKIALTEINSPPINFLPDNRLTNNSFFIKLDKSYEILSVSNAISISNDEIISLKDKVINSGKSKGITEINNHSLRFLKQTKNYGYIIVFQSNELENNFFKNLIITSILIGIVSLILVFVISFFLANRAMKPIILSWQKQGAFVEDASHELRTPLAVVYSNLEVVLDNENETVKSQNNWLYNIQSELERMKKLVNDLLFLARANIEDEENIKCPFNLSNLFDEIYMLFIPLTQKKNIKLILNKEDNVIFTGDEFKIKQLITILLDNAMKYTQESGEIQLKLKSSNHLIQISVIDNGEGISKEHQEKIFGRFYRVDKSRSRKFGGSGLGLAIAKCIVSEHKGSINLNSKVNQDSNFTITFQKKVR